jgi:hypothetical protein
MKYNPNAANADLLPDGWYDATLTAEEKKSRKKQDMMVVTSEVRSNGLPFFIEDYFVGEVPFHMKRFKKLCTVLGLDFDAGEIPARDFEGRGVRVELKTQKSKDPAYDDKNIVAHYAPMESGTPVPANEVPPSGDDIPF